MITEEAERLLQDFKHGKQLGPKSTARLLALIYRLTHRVIALEQALKEKS